MQVVMVLSANCSKQFMILLPEFNHRGKKKTKKRSSKIEFLPIPGAFLGNLLQILRIIILQMFWACYLQYTLIFQKSRKRYIFVMFC